MRSDKYPRNYGSMFKRQEILQTRINELQISLLCECETVEREMLVGYQDALLNHIGSKTHKLLECVLETKTALLNIDESEYLDFEIPYLRGYVKGLYEIISIDKEISKMNVPYVLLLYAETESILAPIVLLLKCLKSFDEFGSGNNHMYYASCNQKEITDTISRFESNYTYSLCILYTKETVPRIETIQKIYNGGGENLFLQNVDKLTTQSIRQTIHTIIRRSCLD